MRVTQEYAVTVLRRARALPAFAVVTRYVAAACYYLIILFSSRFFPLPAVADDRVTPTRIVDSSENYDARARESVGTCSRSCRSCDRDRQTDCVSKIRAGKNCCQARNDTAPCFVFFFLSHFFSTPRASFARRQGASPREAFRLK